MPTRAQEVSPPVGQEGREVHPGVTLTVLAPLAPIALPAVPAALVVERVTLEPGAEIPPHPRPGIELDVVEAGNGMIQTVEGPTVQVVRGGAASPTATPEEVRPGEELRVAAGDVVILSLGSRVRVRAGDRGASVLVFALGAQAADWVAPPTSMGSPKA